ncbi:MAG: SIS domain-containing protein [Bacteroidales bacterium]|nr:SIS domain-containing protein [Bacteroidales bacterium]MBN2821187.1 SIS domain-containing protein [Bacteroidales bacterium]
MLEQIQELLQKESQAILNIPVNNNFEKVIELIYTSVHSNKGKLIASGMGKAGQIANNIATTFSSTGTPAVFLHPSDAQHGDLGVIQENDILLLVSNSGKTREILELFKLSKNLNPNLKIIALVGISGSPLSELVDCMLETGNPEEICPLGLTPTTSTTAMTVMGDILVVLMMKKIGLNAEEYAKRHHGGYLGQKSRIAAKI